MAAAIGIATAAGGTAHAAEPTFINGLSQAVFAQGQANWVNHELWSRRAWTATATAAATGCTST